MDVSAPWYYYQDMHVVTTETAPTASPELVALAERLAALLGADKTREVKTARVWTGGTCVRVYLTGRKIDDGTHVQLTEEDDGYTYSLVGGTGYGLRSVVSKAWDAA